MLKMEKGKQQVNRHYLVQCSCKTTKKLTFTDLYTDDINNWTSALISNTVSKIRAAFKNKVTCILK